MQNTYWRNNKDERHFFKKYTAHFILKRFVCERELETKQNCNILTTTLMAISVVSFSFSRGAQPEAWEPTLCWMLASSTTSCHQQFWSPKLTDFLSSPSYIIVQSPTQSLEWHVWSSSSGNNCHTVHRSLSSGTSVYECTMGFYFVPYRQPTQFLLITAIGMCHFLPVHYFGMACLAGSKVNIQQLFRTAEPSVSSKKMSSFSSCFVSWLIITLLDKEI